MQVVKNKLEKYVREFRLWQRENFTSEQIPDDCAYPFWDEITDFYSELLDKKIISKLDNQDKENLLFLIARNWDIGNMIAWLDSGRSTELSNLGFLSKNDFIILSKSVIHLKDNMYNDAKSQIASSFKKFEKLTDEIEKILLALYNDKDEYTKRLALISLGKLKYKHIEKLIHKSWYTIDDEHHKMACLMILKEHLNNKELLSKYINEALNGKGEYLVDYVKQIIESSKSTTPPQESGNYS